CCLDCSHAPRMAQQSELPTAHFPRSGRRVAALARRRSGFVANRAANAGRDGRIVMPYNNRMTRKNAKPRRKRANGPAAPSPPVDLDVLDRVVGYLLRRAQLAVFHDFFETFSRVNVRPAQFSVLVVIERNPGLKQTQIADALGIKRTNFVSLVDGLEPTGPADARTPAQH